MHMGWKLCCREGDCAFCAGQNWRLDNSIHPISIFPHLASSFGFSSFKSSNIDHIFILTDPISTPPPPSSEPSRIRADQHFRIHIRHPAHVAVPLHTPLDPVLVPSHSEPTGWAIWSRRLRYPAHTPGVIISPRARPPPDIVASTRAGGTLPLSPPPVLAEQEREEGAGEGAVHISLVGRVE
ncbi:hypothetical protein B0H14DRAFT_1232752 [Mycena olivaceomarginata]|nr:hypothetical protein B0H14DRAFT_1232752 [Mycena olivaceomarginata]